MTCYLCGATSFAERAPRVRDRADIRVVECRACGLVTLDSLDHIKPGHYEQGDMHPDERVEDWLLASAPDDARRADMLRPLVAGRRVLDVGSGAGGFLRRAALVAKEAAGVEPEKRARDVYDPATRVYPAIESVERGRVFDLVTAFHVFEHLRDPRGMLQSLARLLDDGGRIVIEVPSADDALLTLYGSDSFARFTYWSQHLFLFTSSTMTRLIEQAGLKAVSVDQFQRYPLSNHLYWLSRQQPGGHQQWAFLDSPELDAAYGASLASIGKCDTLIAHIERLAP